MGDSTVNPRLRAELIEVARARNVITYDQMLSSTDIRDRMALSQELSALADDCARRGEPMLVALGVVADTSAPSAGFYQKAAEHAGYRGSTDEWERLTWWSQYLVSVWEYWRDRDACSRTS